MERNAIFLSLFLTLDFTVVAVFQNRSLWTRIEHLCWFICGNQDTGQDRVRVALTHKHTCGLHTLDFYFRGMKDMTCFQKKFRFLEAGLSDLARQFVGLS